MRQFFRSPHNHGLELGREKPTNPWRSFDQYAQSFLRDDGTFKCPRCEDGCERCVEGTISLRRLREEWRQVVQTYRYANWEWMKLLAVWRKLRLTPEQKRAIDVFGSEGPTR